MIRGIVLTGVACACVSVTQAQTATSNRPYGTGADRAIKSIFGPFDPQPAVTVPRPPTDTGHHQHHGHHHHGHSHFRGSFGDPFFRSSYGYSYSQPLAYSYYSYPLYGGYSPFYDPYSVRLEEQNDVLRRQVNALEAQNRQLAKPAVRLNVGAANPRRADDARAREQLRSGAKLFAAGSYRLAADRFEQAARWTQDDATPAFYLAQALFASKQFVEAANAVKQGLKANPDWLLADIDIRTLYQDPGDYQAQLAVLAGELKANPLDRDALFLLGFELFVAGEKEKARTILEQVARLEPDDVHVKPFFDYFERVGKDPLLPPPE